MLGYFNTFIDIGLIICFLGAFGIFTNKRNILLSVICIERIFYGLNFFLVSISIYLDDFFGEIFVVTRSW